MKLNVSPKLRLPLEAVTETFAILAKRGVGKTYTALVLAEELLEANQTVCIVDPIGVCWGLRSSADGKKAGYPIVVMGGEHGDVPLEEAAGETIADFLVDERQSCVLDLSLFRKRESVRFVTAFAERLYHRNREALHLILDEADAFAPQKPMKEQARMLGAIEDIVRRGRARGLGVTLVTQRAAVLNKNVLTQIESLFVLRTLSPQDRKAMEAWIVAHDAQDQREAFMDTLATLPIGTAWFWSPGWLDVFEKIAIRKRRTFDSSATPKAGAKKTSSAKKLADVDLEALKTRIASTIEKAKANDPRELKKRVAELEREVQKKPTSAPAPRAERVEVPVLGKDEISRLESSVKELRVVTGHVSGELAAVERRLETIVDGIAKVLQNGHRPAPSVSPAPRRTAPRSRAGERSTPAEPAQLGKGERVILAAIAQHANGVTRQQLTVLTGYKRSSRDTYLQRLKASGLVLDEGGVLVATLSGEDVLGADFEPLPTGQALREYWLERLPAGERTVLEPILKAYPEAVHRDALDVGYQRSSRDTYLQRLGARKLVETPSPGYVRAAEELF